MKDSVLSEKGHALSVNLIDEIQRLERKVPAKNQCLMKHLQILVVIRHFYNKTKLMKK